MIKNERCHLCLLFRWGSCRFGHSEFLFQALYDLTIGNSQATIRVHAGETPPSSLVCPDPDSDPSVPVWVESGSSRMTVKIRPIICGKKQRKSPEIMRFQDFSGGDKRDRTADLMTASCDRFVISGDFEYNTSVPPAKSAGFRKVLSAVSTRFRAHLGHNLGQGSWANSEDSKWSRHGL